MTLKVTINLAMILSGKISCCGIIRSPFTVWSVVEIRYTAMPSLASQSFKVIHHWRLLS